MPRADLLALDAETLVVLSNRGLVKRAQSELESGQVTFTLEEDEGAVTVRWSDEVECRLPAGKALSDGRCTCPATTLCRHLIRTVLAYQHIHSSAAGTQSEASEPHPSDTPHAAEELLSEPQAPSDEPWDPGAITDETLAQHLRPSELARGRRLYTDGQVIDLVRSRKPTAYFHTLATTVRFLVPNDLRYTHCDCAEAPPCAHVAAAVLGFRLLSADAAGGTVSTRVEPLPCPTALLDDIEAALGQLVQTGIANVPQAWTDRLTRLEARCRSEDLVWPAEILADLAEQRRAYVEHDARFSPRRVADLVGELLIRMDAIRADTGAIPSLFVRGSKSDRVTEVGHARLIGLGCGVTIRKGGAEIRAYLQEANTGTIVTIGRDFSDPSPESGDPPRDFSALAQWVAAKGTSLAALGAGQLVARGGKRSPGGQFTLGRAQAAFNPQTFQWEALRPPVLVEDFQELTARLASQPPSCLGPRRVGTRLAVCPVAGVAHAEFCESDQTLHALIQDAAGNVAHLVHPFTSRGREGAELLITRLGRTPDAVRFVSAQAQLSSNGLVLHPLSVVFEEEGRRTMIQPWVDRQKESTPAGSSHAAADLPPLTGPLDALSEVVSEQWLLGLDSIDSRAVAHWRSACEGTEALGYHRLTAPAGRLMDHLERRMASPVWNSEPAVGPMLLLTAWLRLAQEASR